MARQTLFYSLRGWFAMALACPAASALAGGAGGTKRQASFLTNPGLSSQAYPGEEELADRCHHPRHGARGVTGRSGRVDVMVVRAAGWVWGGAWDVLLLMLARGRTVLVEATCSYLDTSCL